MRSLTKENRVVEGRTQKFLDSVFRNYSPSKWLSFITDIFKAILGNSAILELGISMSYWIFFSLFIIHH